MLSPASSASSSGTSGEGDVTAKAQEIENDKLAELFVKFGEKMVLRRALRYEISGGTVASYMHGEGKIGIMIEAEGSDDPVLLKDVCMHIAAFSPAYIVPADVPAEAVAKEKEIAAAQLAGKPANMIEKILTGKINKWYSEVCLMQQPWIHDDKTCLAKLAPKLVIKKFARWTVGQEL